MSDLDQHNSFLGCFTQIFRILVGPALILVSVVALIANRPPLWGAFDLVFGTAVLLTVTAGLLEPESAAGGPAGPGARPSGRLRYALIVLAASAVLFALARFIVPKVM